VWLVWKIHSSIQRPIVIHNCNWCLEGHGSVMLRKTGINGNDIFCVMYYNPAIFFSCWVEIFKCPFSYGVLLEKSAANKSWSAIQSVPGGEVSILGGHSIGHSKQKKCICTCVLLWTVSETELFHCTVPKLLVRKRYYILFLIPVFIVQVAKLVQFTWCNTFSKIQRQYQCTLQLAWEHGVLLVCTVKYLYLGNHSE
jgi:hypothetical protein